MIVQELLVTELPGRIDVLLNQRTENMLFVDAVEYLCTNFEIELCTAFFHLLSRLERREFPLDLEIVGQEISSSY
jgi:hypothetical protein